MGVQRRRSNQGWEVWEGCLEEAARAMSWGHPGDLDKRVRQGGCWAFGSQIQTKGKRLWRGRGEYKGWWLMPTHTQLWSVEVALV